MARWDPRLGGGTGRYVENGRIVSSKRVRHQLDLILQSAERPADELFSLLRGGQISLSDFQLEGMKLIKNTHITAIALQRGGFDNASLSDYGRAGAAIREQYGHWQNLVEDIGAGRVALDGRLRQRLRQYVNAGRQTYNASARTYASSSGATHVGSVLSDADHCVECVALNGRWFRIGDPEYLPPGQRICRNNCKCGERYGVEVDGRIVSIAENAIQQSLELVQ